VENTKTESAAQYRYWAFISYSSRDAAVATRLHQRLERYNIPRDLRGRPGLDSPVPSKLFPVFRDREELPLSSDLGSSIEDALRLSRYLIVICSPAAAHSRWVNEEVRYFKALGREDRILAIIVAGEPNASDVAATADQECFPPALRYRVDRNGQITEKRVEPIGGDLRPGGDGWHRVFLKAVAGITGLGFDAFARRDRKRRLRRQVAAGIAGAALLAGGAWAIDYNRLKVADYADLGTQWGVPVGVSALSGSAPAGRWFHYRFEFRRNKVRSVLYLDRGGHLSNDNDQHAARHIIRYREDGSLQEIDLQHSSGRLVMRETFSEPQETPEGRIQYIDFRQEHQDAPFSPPESADTLEHAPEGSERGTSEITAAQLLYDSSGRTSRRINLNAYHQKQATAEGVYGRRYLYTGDSLLPSAIENLGYDGSPAPSRSGVLRVEVTDSSSDAGEQHEERYFGLQQNPVMVKAGYHSYRRTIDAKADRSEVAYFGVNDEPVQTIDGYCRLVVSFDARAARRELALYGVDGHAVLGRDGYHRLVEVLDTDGNPVKDEFYGGDGRPVFARDGYHRATMAYDSQGNLVEMAVFGIDGTPVLARGGYHRVTQAFDARGNTVEQSFYGVAGEPIEAGTRFEFQTHRVQMVYDDQDRVIETAYFTSDDKPSAPTLEGYTRLKQEYDQRGNVASWSYFLDTKPMAGLEHHFHRATQVFDSRGNLTEVAYFGVDGQPVLYGNWRYHRYKLSFDARGRVIETAYFGINGEPVASLTGDHRVTRKYDEPGNPIEIAHFGVPGDTTFQSDCQRETDSYDDSGHQIKSVCVSSTGDQGKVTTTKYDAKGNSIESAYFDLNNRPILDSSDCECHRVTTAYDERGNLVQIAYFGIDDQPMITNGASTDSGAHRATVSYDARGQRLDERYFGVHGEPVLNRNGYHRLTYTYDARGLLVEQAYFGTGNEPILSGGVHRVVTTYDAGGKEVKRVLLDLEGHELPVPEYPR
jgi:hypothetical protein